MQWYVLVRGPIRGVPADDRVDHIRDNAIGRSSFNDLHLAIDDAQLRNSQEGWQGRYFVASEEELHLYGLAPVVTGSV